MSNKCFFFFNLSEINYVHEVKLIKIKLKILRP